jgi:hypothetical protein
MIVDRYPVHTTCFWSTIPARAPSYLQTSARRRPGDTGEVDWAAGG